MENIIKRELGTELYSFLSEYVNWEDNSTLVLSTSSIFNIENQPENKFDAIVNIKKINNILRINKFFIEINSKLQPDGIFIGCVETHALIVNKIFKKYPKIIANFIYILWFTYRRILPKVPYLKKLYFFLTLGVNRVLSKAEVLGRLVSCGFEIMEYKEYEDIIYFVVKKVKMPAVNYQPSYGPIFKMRRIGKNGKIIFVYKFRTMHPYAEFLQNYIVEKYGYTEVGKPANDFRLTLWGKFLRKYWLDELPQLINVMKGEMKIMGVRPLSERFLNEYPEDVKNMRMKHKPGCVPPYVALLKQEVNEYIEAERTYLLDKEKHPYTTDIRYFFRAIYNILTNKIRSA